MNCIDLVKDLNYEILQGDMNVEVNEVVTNTNNITEGCLFICIKGVRFDAHNVIEDIVAKGAKVIVVEREITAPGGITVIKVENTRYAMAFISAAYFGHPGDKLKVIGITGTKGKTTTTYMVKSILEHAGYKVGLIGTIETIIGETHIPAVNTTPESFELQRRFKMMLEEGIEICVMEVSSQALMLHRTQGFTFELGILTNISPDHIGPNEHHSFEHYMECKGLLFQQCKVAYINNDDKHYKDVIKGHTCEIHTYGLTDKSDIYACDLHQYRTSDTLGISFTVCPEKMLVDLPMPGTFSVYNALCAISICEYFNVDREDMIEGMRHVSVKGRIEMVENDKGITVVIDYAHNGLSLESLLTTLQKYDHKRMITVFGSDADRDKERCTDLGTISGKMADFSIISTDNPRGLDPMYTMKPIEEAVKAVGGKYTMIADREEAIRYALDMSEPGDIVVLAGKGHEDYQYMENNRKVPFNERKIVEDIFNEEC